MLSSENILRLAVWTDHSFPLSLKEGVNCLKILIGSKKPSLVWFVVSFGCSSICNFSQEFWNPLRNFTHFIKQPASARWTITTSCLSQTQRLQHANCVLVIANVVPSHRLHVGDKPDHEADPAVSQEGWAAHRRRWLRVTPTPKTWHNVEVSRTTVTLLKPARHSNRQHISTFFLPLTPSITMLHYSTGCSVISSCAREPFALQAGPWRRCASTAWRWGLLFICRPGANCYSIALTTQRYILCLGALSRDKALTQNIEGTNLFPVCEH